MIRVALALLALVACNPAWVEKCRANGGRVEEFNCHTVVDVIPTRGCVACPMPRTVCEHRCVGARAEVR